MKQIFLLSVLCLFCFSVFGQFQNPCAPVGEDRCENAPLINSCQLDGWSSHTDPPGLDYSWNGDVPRAGWCNGRFTIENNQWLKFEAVEDHLYIDVDVSGCSNREGIQMAAYELVDPVTGNCPGEQITCFGEASGQNLSLVFEIDDLVPGVEYLLMIDGFAGDGCPFVLDITSGIPPTLEVDASPLAICPGVEAEGALNATITNGGGNNLLFGWATENGNIVSGDFTLNPIIDEPGDYTFFAYNLETCCGGFTTVTVEATTELPEAQATVIQHIGCTTQTATVSAQGSETDNGFNVYEYIWTFPNGNIAGTGFELEGLTFSGEYILIVRNVSTGCESEVTVEVLEDFSEPEISLQEPPILTCNNSSISLLVDAPDGSTFEWTNDNGFSSMEQAPSVTEPGAYQVLVTGPNGCASEETIVVTDDLDIPEVQIQALVLDCANPTASLVVINDNEETTYSWQGPNFTSEEMEPVISEIGTYTLVATNPNGCFNTFMIDVIEDVSPPDIAIENDNVLDCNLTEFAISSVSDSEITSYAWTGPGNFSSAEASPSISAAGIYSLTVIDEKGCTNTTEITITDDLTPPEASLIVSDVLTCATNSVQIESTSDQIITAYEWSNNLGSDSTATVTEAGNYTVTVTGENGCTEAFDINVADNFAAPTPNAGPDAQLTCAQSETMLTASGTSNTGGGLSYEWTLNGNTIGMEANLPVSATGTYELIVTDDINGCTAIDEVVVSTDDNIPAVVLEEAATIDCNNLSITLSGVNSSAGPNIVYEWLDQNQNALSNNATIDVSSIGTYTFIVRNTDNGCESELPIQVGENFDAPDPEVINIEMLNCLVTDFTVSAIESNTDIDDVSYQWFDTDSGSLLGQSSNLDISTAGNYNLVVTNNENGCITEFPFPIEINEDTPIADAGSPFTITCAETSATLDASGSQGNNLTYQWLASDGSIFAENATTSTSEEGEYTLIVTNTESGCSAESRVIIDTNADFPEIEFNTPSVINCNQILSFLDASNSSGTGNLSFSWFDESQTLISNDATIEVDNAGSYTLVLTDTDSDCTVEESIVVTDNFLEPNADAGEDQIITCDIVDVQLNGGNSSSGSNFSYAWFNANNVLLGNNETVSVETPGEYTLVVTDNTNGCSASAAVVVTPDENIPQVEVANDGVLSCMQSEVNLFSTLVDNPNYSYTWQNETGETISTSTSFITDVPGVYTLTAIDGTNGCSNSMSILVEDNFSTPELSSGTPDVLNCNLAEVEIAGLINDPTQDIRYVWSSETEDNIGNEASLTVDAAGTYSLIATNQNSGCTSSLEIEVVDNFDIITPNTAVSNVIDCNVQSAGAEAIGIDDDNYSYEWYDEDGNFVSEGKDLVTGTAGTYQVVAINTENGCSASALAIIESDLEVPPISIPSAEVLNCQVLDVQLTGETDDVGNYEYIWLNPSGTPVSTDISINVSEPGEYQLFITNPNNGCENSTNVLVLQDVNMPEAIIDDLAPLGLSCTQSEVLLDGSASTPVGNVQYQWFDENGNLLSENATYIASSAGTYNLIITDLSTFCENSMSTVVSQDAELPTVDIAPPTNLTCNVTSVVLDASQSELGSEFEYSWTTPPGASGFDETDILNPSASTPGTYTLTIINTLTGCQNETSIEIGSDFAEPNAQANVTDELDCVTSEVQLNTDGSSEGSQFERSWIIDGVTLTNLDFVTVQNPGVYTLIVTDLNNGCTSESFVTVTENTEQPTDIGISADDIVCFGDNNGFIAVNDIIGGTAPYTIELNGQIFSDFPNIDNLGPGNYPLLVTDATGCTLETDITIEEPPRVFVELGEDITINLGESTFLTASTNVDQITWSSEGDLSCEEECLIQEVNPFETTTYEILVMDENGCPAVDNITVNVRFDRAVYIPNIFSPNADGINDFFRVFGNSSVLRVKNMLIANKWGEIVYEEEDILLSDERRFWNGEFRGEDLNNNVLVYYVVVEYIDGRTESFKGDVTLIR